MVTVASIVDLVNQSGIYQIMNLVNGKIYVGSAVKIKSRFRTHLHALRKGNHENSKLQRAWNKYGAEVFEFQILEIIPDKQDLIKAEQRYLDELNPFYNILKTAGSSLGLKLSDEAKNKIRLTHLGRKLTAEHKAKIARYGPRGPLSLALKTKLSIAHLGIPNQNKRPVESIDPCSGEITEYGSISEAQVILKKKVDICNACKTGRKRNGTYWQYLARGPR